MNSWTDFQEFFRTNTKKLIKTSGFTQTDIAQRMGIKQAGLSKLISDGNPTLESLYKLSHALDMKPYEFLMNLEDRKSVESKDQLIESYAAEVQKLKAQLKELRSKS